MMEAGVQITEKDAKLLLAAEEEQSSTAVSRAARRADQVAGQVIKPNELSIGFVAKKFCFYEDSSELMLDIEKVGELTLDIRVGIEYQTSDGNMLASVGHYKP